MSGSRKFFLNNYPIFITSRTVQGLPFVANKTMATILESILARACRLFPVSLFAVMFMQNHLHLGVVVTDPELIPAFMAYVKSESAGAVNRLLGRSKCKVWEDGYDSPIILDSEKALNQIVYLYTNPAKANLVDRIEDYPGLSTWGFFNGNESSKSCPWIRRKRIPKLPSRRMTPKEDEEFRNSLVTESVVAFDLNIDPNCWIQCFSDLDNSSPDAINQEILRRIKEKEKEYRAKRSNPVKGRTALMTERIDKHYLPKKRGRRMWCIGSDPNIRREFIAKLKALFKEAESVYQQWKLGARDIPFPPGLFPPSQLRRANLAFF